MLMADGPAERLRAAAAARPSSAVWDPDLSRHFAPPPPTLFHPADVEYLNSRDATIMGSRNGHAPIYMWYTFTRKVRSQHA